MRTFLGNVLIESKVKEDPILVEVDTSSRRRLSLDMFLIVASELVELRRTYLFMSDFEELGALFAAVEGSVGLLTPGWGVVPVCWSGEV